MPGPMIQSSRVQAPLAVAGALVAPAAIVAPVMRPRMGPSPALSAALVHVQAVNPNPAPVLPETPMAQVAVSIMYAGAPAA